MTLGMRTRALGLVLLLPLITGCPSRDGNPGASAEPSKNGTGPLANLESVPPNAESWSNDDKQPVALLVWPAQNVKLSASCKAASGELACDAIRFLRGGNHVQMARRFLDGRQSAGVKACVRLNQPIITVRNALGAEDSLCKFPDGSMVATGTLEQYGMTIIE